MIQIIDKSQCTGCEACLSICLVNAIEMQEDEEGFRYPKVDEEKCIHCNKCNSVCPMYSNCIGEIRDNGSFDTQFYAGQLYDEDVLTEVSSGGAFWGLAQAVINLGGVVYGAAQEDVDYIYHIRTETLEETKSVRRSKYFQSHIGDSFRNVEQDLKYGKMVLFVGTGCQIAGLINYLGRQYDKLYTCDVVCHGVPSMLVWRSYRSEKEEKENKQITELIFRDKSAGWSHNQYKITYADGTTEFARSSYQTFHAGYLQGLFYRPSCPTCKFAKLPRFSDITLADYWKYNGPLLEKGDLGISLIVVNSIRGKELLSKAEKYIQLEKTSRELALESCRHLTLPPRENPNRKKFFEELYKNGYYSAAEKYINLEKPSAVKNKIKKLFRIGDK